MNRREVLKTSSLILGYTVSVGTAAAIMNGCAPDPSIDWMPKNLSTRQALLVADMVELIIPKTETPGAKDALVDRYIDELLDCYPEEEKLKFTRQLDAFDAQVKSDFGDRFYKLSSEDQKKAMDALVMEARSDDGSPLFGRIKEWTVTGYCISEAGATEHLEWNPVPGPYRGCIDFSEVGKTWALP